MSDLQGFQEFYTRWPRKIARADALKAWAQTKNTRPPLLELLAAIDRLMAWRGQLAARREFVPALPYPATWLRGERWADEFDAPSVNTAAATSEAQLQWSALRNALRADDPRSLTDHRTRYAMAAIGWPVLMQMRADQVVHMGREFERLFNSALAAPRATVHAFPTINRRAVNG